MSKAKRATTYTPEIGALICEKLAEGQSLRSICKTTGMPPESTVRRWVVEDVAGFAAHYTRARDLGLDSLAEEILEIANTPQVGTKTTTKATGTETTEADMIEHRRLQVDARKWYLSKLAPKKYGDKLDVTAKVTTQTLAEELAELNKLSGDGAH